MLMKVHRTENEFGLIRNIVYFTNQNNSVINSKVILQYYINNKVCGDVESITYTVQSHGNSKREKPFYVIKKSTIADCKNKVLHSGSKRSVSVLYDTFHRDLTEDSDYGDHLRSKKQLIDFYRSQSADNEVGDILGYNNELGNDSILWYHGDIPTDLWVIGIKEMVAEIPVASECNPLSIDPTFNFGEYEVTPLTYRNMLFKCKSKNTMNTWVPATMIGPVIIQHDKSAETYDTALT